jgi:hypothetical protein
MRVWTGAIATLALVGSTGAHAQGVYVAEPAPVYVNLAPYYAAAPVVVAPAPYVGPGYVYGEPYIVDYRTGRWCRIESNGYRWCWTP